MGKVVKALARAPERNSIAAAALSRSNARSSSSCGTATSRSTSSSETYSCSFAGFPDARWSQAFQPGCAQGAKFLGVVLLCPGEKPLPDLDDFLLGNRGQRYLPAAGKIL